MRPGPIPADDDHGVEDRLFAAMHDDDLPALRDDDDDAIAPAPASGVPRSDPPKRYDVTVEDAIPTLVIPKLSSSPITSPASRSATDLASTSITGPASTFTSAPASRSAADLATTSITGPASRPLANGPISRPAPPVLANGPISRPEPPRVASVPISHTDPPVAPRDPPSLPKNLPPPSFARTAVDRPVEPERAADASLDVTRNSHPGLTRNSRQLAGTRSDDLDETRDSGGSLPLLDEPRAGASFSQTASPSHRDFATTAAEQSTNLGATLAAPPSKEDPIPRQIGRFAVLRRLGRGGMGTVYAAFDEQLTRRVAIKVLHADTGERAPLTAEARAMAQLSHPNVVQVYELGIHDGDPFIAMEFVEGRTLGDWLTAEKPPWQLALRRFIAAGEGLAAAHRAGLVHRDFKPDNVLLGADEVPRVADFGLARPSAEGVAQVAGTPAYMSPEQHEGSATDARSDQFSFCIAVHEALYGRPPFAGDTYVDRAANVLAGDLQPPPSHGPVPRRLYDAIVVGLARDPARRYPSMDVLLAELRRYLPRPRPTSFYVSLAALAAASLLVIAVLVGRTPPPGTSPAAAANIARHAQTARTSAEEAAWIYPLPDTTRAAIREVVALEKLPAPASELAHHQAERLRDHFAKQLAALGQRYWDDPKTRPFARDFYAQTLMFRPEHELALKRGNFTMGQLAQLRDEAEQSGFTPEQLAAVAPLRILADPDDPRLAALLASLPAACDTPISQQDPARGSGLAGPAPEPAPPPVPTETITPPEPEEPHGPPPPPGGVPPRPPRAAAFDPSALIEEAENARRRGQDDEAARLFRQALAGAPREATALAALSDIAFDRGDFQEAADLATQASRAAPTIGEHHTRLGDAYSKLKRTADARAEYQRALDLGDLRARRRLDIDAPKP